MSMALLVEGGEHDPAKVAEALGWSYDVENDMWNSDAFPGEASGKFTDGNPPDFLNSIYDLDLEISRRGWSWCRERDGTFYVWNCSTLQRLGVSSRGTKDLAAGLLAALLRSIAFVESPKKKA